MDNFYLVLETFFQNLLFPCLDNWQINNQSFKKTALIWIATCRKTSLYARNSIIYVGLILAKRKWNCCFSFWVNSTQSLTKKNNLHPTTHGLRTPREEIAFTARPKIQSQSQIFRYGGSLFCLPHRPNFSDIFDLCLHWVSVVRVKLIFPLGHWASIFLSRNSTLIKT